ncbi:cyclase family protein [Microbacterium sp. zg-YB36]|uniref:cyclase family protein n=1 Tax=Microbacterium sp. zg-YB36 TaxID=2969407 RepID=UPI00214B575B|nr:cyclase family protein [Microbacterium sp. zg-YB36]MDL5352218.1 cyclase family protein [Microbacterium sp. zg-YB36]
MSDYRAVFDAQITFINGGSLSAEGFRLDLPSKDTDEAEIARLLVQHLSLALVGEVRLQGLRVVAEQHRGSRGIANASAVTPGGIHRLVDLSHTIRAGLVTLPGVPAPVITPHLTRADAESRYARGTTFVMDIVTLPGNTGTYIDSPFHRFEGGADLASLSLETLVDLPTEVFHVTDAGQRGIPASVFYDRDVRGKAVLLHTGWDRHFGTPQYGVDAPFLTEDGVRYLADQGVTLVGIDSVNIDDMSSDARGERPAHTVFLGSGIHVVEHLTHLEALAPSGALFTVVPPKVEGFGTFPVRAFAKVPQA